MGRKKNIENSQEELTDLTKVVEEATLEATLETSVPDQSFPEFYGHYESKVKDLNSPLVYLNQTNTLDSVKLEYKEAIKEDKYIRKENGDINWFAHLEDDQIFLNQSYKTEIEKRYNKPTSELSLKEIDEKYLLISLNGLKSLAKLKGYKSIRLPNFQAQPGFAYAVCEIHWDDGTIVADSGDACPDNVGQAPFCYYLSTLAANRAIGRAIRSSLGITALCREEIGVSPVKVENTMSQADPRKSLQDKLEGKGRDFNSFKTWWNANHAKEGKEIEGNTWSELEVSQTWGMLGVLKQLEKKN